MKAEVIVSLLAGLCLAGGIAARNRLPAAADHYLRTGTTRRWRACALLAATRAEAAIVLAVALLAQLTVRLFANVSGRAVFGALGAIFLAGLTGLIYDLLKQFRDRALKYQIEALGTEAARRGGNCLLSFNENKAWLTGSDVERVNAAERIRQACNGAS
jgi:hypothetical protein